MATSNMRYDHPQYQVSYVHAGSVSTIDAGHRQLAFVAFADMIVRAVHVNPVVIATNSALTNVSPFYGVRVAQAGAVTSTATLISDSAFGTNTAGTSVLATVTLSRGETFRVVNTGTDLGSIFGVTVESTIIPGAAVTS